ncbi:MAG: nucleotidyltransferase family protein [Anaerolineaceae bacterium]
MTISQEVYEAIILVGGKGTRLQSVIKDKPKPMALVHSRPFLEWIILSLRSRGVTKIILCTGYLGNQIEDYFQDGKTWGVEIQYSRDPKPLGTGGAISHAAKLITTERFFVMNGDSYSRFNLTQFMKYHLTKNALITMGLVNVDDCRRYGSVQIAKDGIIQTFLEKPSVQQAGLINAGTYLIEQEIVDSIPKNQFFSLETDLFPKFVESRFYAIIGNSPFIDIGTPESFRYAEQFIKQEHI